MLSGASGAAPETVDILIIGGGPAGCVLASRLSEDPARRVLLVEAGADSPPGGEHPDIRNVFAPIATGNAAFHWPGLRARLSAGAGDRGYVQGFGIGGGSNINGMGADRGNPADYDEWRDLGAAGWGWQDVLPFFRKLERDLDFGGPNATPIHGDGGPFPIRRLDRPRWGPFCTAFGEALEDRGLPFLEDYNGDFREGFAAAPTNCVADGRMSAAMAYLTPQVRARPNLHILTGAHADRLVIQDRQVRGAHLVADGAARTILARETVLCCGAIQSPALLLRSGIGPAAQLRQLGIAVVRDLPGTGANLLNHPYILLATYLKRDAAQPRDNPWFLQNWARYSSRHPGCVENDMHLLPLNRTAWHALGRRVGAVGLSVFRAYSKGSVTLASADARDAPRIEFNLLDDARDFERLVSGTRFLLELLDSEAVAARRNEIILPPKSIVARISRQGAANRIAAALITAVLDSGPLRRRLLAPHRVDTKRLLADDAALRAFVRANAQVQYHVCGTCRMGSAEDPDAVVDPVGRVHGIGGLRVADASIFPTVPRANTHVSVLMAAEKIADAMR